MEDEMKKKKKEREAAAENQQPVGQIGRAHV